MAKEARMLERMRDERGVALVVALLVTFVVLLLSTTVFAMAVRNSEQSANDRKRLQSVSAAEAGLNAAYQHLTSPPGGLTGLADTLQDSVGSGPSGSTYDVEITYYENADGTVPMDPSSFSITYYPKSALIRSIGASNGKIDRTMESFVVLTPVFSGFEGAIVSHSSLNLTNRFTLNGYLGDDGHIYVLNGDFSAPSGLETIKGNVYVPTGSATVGTSVHIYGSIWANLNVTLDQPQIIVDGDLKASTGGIAVVAGTAGGQGYYCTSVSGDANIAGGAQQTCTLGTPPSQPFPQITYDQSKWATPPPGDPVYTNFQTFGSCTDARDYVQSTGSYAATGFSGHNVGRTVVFITATCSFEPTNNAQITLKNDLAIITRGGINLAQRSTWVGESGIKYLHLISAYPDSGSPTCPTQDVTVGQFTNFDGHVAGIVYSPCTVSMLNNNTAFQGQVIGENVIIGNNFNMTFLPVKVPGQKLSGFKQDIAYIREVQ